MSVELSSDACFFSMGTQQYRDVLGGCLVRSHARSRPVASVANIGGLVRQVGSLDAKIFRT